MEFILREIEKALDCGLYYLALQSTLTLPDICGAIQNETKKPGDRYKEWYRTYAVIPYPNALTAEDCYYFRCACVHQGSTQSPKSTYKRILFIVPNNTITLCGYTVINDALHINIETFCRNMVFSVRRWEAQVKGTESFIRNYGKIIKLYPSGFPPYIVGIPTIT